MRIGDFPGGLNLPGGIYHRRHLENRSGSVDHDTQFRALSYACRPLLFLFLVQRTGSEPEFAIMGRTK